MLTESDRTIIYRAPGEADSHSSGGKNLSTIAWRKEKPFLRLWSSLSRADPAGGLFHVKTFYLIDGHAQIFRAYYAPFSAQLNAPDGEPTKATYIFTQMMLDRGFLAKTGLYPSLTRPLKLTGGCSRAF